VLRKALITSFVLALGSSIGVSTPAHAGLTPVRAAVGSSAAPTVAKAARAKFARLQCVRAPRILILGVAY
jgi:hypothetical protein